MIFQDLVDALCAPPDANQDKRHHHPRQDFWVDGQACGFARVGVRKGYYPSGREQRENAVVMSLALKAAAPLAPPSP